MPYIFNYDKSRVAAFCDAVFSIAMTLLILEIEIPSIEALQNNSFTTLLWNRTPSFIGFLVSFIVIAFYWISHLRIFKYVKTINGKLLWLNIFLLLFVVFLPFSTALYVGGFDEKAPFFFYCLNLVFLGFFNFLLIYNISKNQMPKNHEGTFLSSWLRFRSLNGLFVWILAAILAPFFPILARCIFVLIFVIQFFGDRFYKKKLNI